jgi:hypothetical protein
MPGPILITLAGVPLYGRDSDGVMWDVQRLDGWDSADVRQDLQPRPNAHGSYDQDAWYAERKPTVEGTLFAPAGAGGGGGTTLGSTLLRQAEQRLSALTSDERLVTLRVDEPPYARQVLAQRNGALQLVHAGAVTQWLLPLVAPDPVRYAVSDQSAVVGPPVEGVGFSFPISFPFTFGTPNGGGDVTVTNAGNFPVWPVLRLEGRLSDPVVRNDTTGEELDVRVDLAAGDWLTIDSRDRTIVLNDIVSRYGDLRRGSSFPRVAPGQNTFQLRAASSGPTAALTITYRSGWM